MQPIDADNEKLLKGKSYYNKEKNQSVRVYNLELTDLIENYREYVKIGLISIHLNVITKDNKEPVKVERNHKVKEKFYKHEFRDWSSLRLESKEIKQNKDEIIFLKTTKTFSEVINDAEDFKEEPKMNISSENLQFEKNFFEKQLATANETILGLESDLNHKKLKNNFLRTKIHQFCEDISLLERQLHSANVLTKYMTLRHVDLHSIHSVYKEINDQKFDCTFDEEKEFEQFIKHEKTKRRRGRMVFKTNVGEYLTEKLKLYQMNLKVEKERPP